MTRLSLIQRNLKRERLVKKYSKKRIALKKIIKNKKTSPEAVSYTHLTLPTKA